MKYRTFCILAAAFIVANVSSFFLGLIITTLPARVSGTPTVVSATVTSPVAHDLASHIGPAIAKQVASRRDTIVANAGGPIKREAVRLGFPVLIREIPTITEAGIDAALDEFGKLSITDLVERMVKHNQAKGRASANLIGSGPMP